MHPGPGPLALVGSGEYLEVMAGVEGALIEGRPRRYVQIPTAAAPEGPGRLRYWLDLGAAQAERLGVEPVPVVVRDRDEAGSEDLAALIHGAGLIYLSGGNPQFLARTLRGTRVWAAIEAAWRSGAALAGCSAGAIALTDWVPAVRAPAREPEPGLGVLPWLRVLPHFDRMRSWAPELATRAAAGAPPGTTVIGIDEDTAIVDLTGGGRSWQVHGRQQAWVLDGGQDGGAGRPFPAGAAVQYLRFDLYKSALILSERARVRCTRRSGTPPDPRAARRGGADLRRDRRGRPAGVRDLPAGRLAAPQGAPRQRPGDRAAGRDPAAVRGELRTAAGARRVARSLPALLDSAPGGAGHRTGPGQARAPPRRHRRTAPNERGKTP